MSDGAVLAARNITRRFGAFTALKSVNFHVGEGEIVALLGENGAGKSTLMNVLSGTLAPTDGTVLMDGAPVRFASPLDASAKGIGMVHQHFLLVPTVTVAENLLLNAPKRVGGAFSYPVKAVLKDAQILAGRLGWTIAWQALAGDLPVGTQQRVEIIKALRGQTRVLIFDEPTAVLTPTETPELFATIKRLADEGRGIVFISHKLGEVMELAHRVVVLRRGEVVLDTPVGRTTEAALATAMVGADSDAAALLHGISRSPNGVRTSPNGDGITLRDVRITAPDNRKPLLNGIRFTVAPGEILGVAGVDGNGQEELAAVLSGLVRPTSGTISVNGNVVAANPVAFRRAGVAVIPADRHERGLMMPLSITENVALGVYDAPEYRAGFLLRWRKLRDRATDFVKRFDIRTNNGTDGAVRDLSGGNQQKVVIARALGGAPKVIVAVNPTRGLDVGAIAYVHNALRAAQAGGAAIIVISTELSEVQSLATSRVAVLFDGRISGIAPPDAPAETFGLLMGGKAVPGA